MKELKTLKDIGDFDNGCTEGYTKLLKEEAIKHIKSFEETEKMCGLLSTQNRLFGKIEAFKDFFNITEEDLK